MRAKLMLLSGNGEAACLSLYAQQTLTDLAVTFGHSFIILEDKISELSLQKFSSAMTEEVITASEECDAVLSIAGDQEGLQALAGGLGCILCSHIYTLPDCLAEYSLLKSNQLPRGILAYPMALDQSAFSRASNHLYKRAQSENLPVSEVPYQGARRSSWVEVTDAVANNYFIRNPRRLAPETMMSDVLNFPQSMGVVFTSKNVCEILNAGAAGLSGIPSFVFDVYWDEKGTKLYAIQIFKSNQPDSLSPFGLLYALVDMLKYSLNLSEESDCLRTCINNVLEAGWRTADIAMEGHMRVTSEAIFKLISEQIELVAEFITH